MKLKAKHFAWIYLLNEGSIGEWSCYGGGFSRDKKLTDAAYHDILNHGINWGKTKAPMDSYESSFVATDAGYSDDHETMEGTLFTNNGNKYKFKIKFTSENIFKVMESVHGIETIEAFVAEKILKEM